MLIYRYLKISIFLTLLMLPGVGYSQYADVTFDVNHINSCVYEVVVPKPLNDPLTYEKPLPFDLLPFQIRNDKYFSVGTAFAYSKTEFITAGHVMNLGSRSHFKEIFIRDTKGNVFAVDQIVKFSSRRDFVVFTVKGRQSPDYLEANLNPEISEKVFAVGNALGQGVVIRDGLYTSNTPEEVDGKWNWIRFSAAASPGNSGGPLLDKNGKVVGLVLSKSLNENLNIALPIAEINNASGNDAEIFQKVLHQLEIFDFTKTGILDTTIKLPMSLNDFNKAYTTICNEFNSKLKKELLSENKPNTFPNGAGSNKMMYNSSTNPFPQLITKREDGNWEPGQPQNIGKADLENNGKIAHGTLKITSFAKIEKPDNISLKDLCSDSKLFMDLMLKAINLTRVIGPEKIRITSLGKADNEYIHNDAYGRKWLVKTWPMEYCDQEIASFILPVPDGLVVMTKVDQTGTTLDDHVGDMKVLVDFVNVAYGGTLKQWREYLEMTDLIPSIFANIAIKPSDGSLLYTSKRFKAACDSNMMNINDNNFFVLAFGYFKDGESVVWDVVKMILSESKFEKGGFGLSRLIKPIDNNDKYGDFWQRLVDGRKPFDKQILMKGDSTTISAVHKPQGTTKSNKDCDVLYGIFHGKNGVIDQKEMEAKLDNFISNVVVHEN